MSILILVYQGTFGSELVSQPAFEFEQIQELCPIIELALLLYRIIQELTLFEIPELKLV
jgi:hypothetical protein